MGLSNMVHFFVRVIATILLFIVSILMFLVSVEFEGVSFWASTLSAIIVFFIAVANSYLLYREDKEEN